MVNRKKADRARQFLPFDALKGYKEAIVEKQRVIVSKKDLSEDDAKILDYKLNQVDVGMMIKVIYYCENNYVLLEGMVSKIDYTYQLLKIVTKEISFTDILDIKSDEIQEEENYGA